MLDIKTTRAKTGLSQSDFAKRLGVSQAAVAYWEKGDKKPTQEQVENIRTIFPIEATHCAVDPLWVAMSAISGLENAGRPPPMLRHEAPRLQLIRTGFMPASEK